ncbi:MAG TPA: MoxR family ATPase [Gemmatales bacterium]|nr:MoxR family ATPase [Gemmatales bacterium]
MHAPAAQVGSTQRLSAWRTEMDRVIVGQRRLLDRLLIGLVTQGHILVEGVPGLAKTLAVRTLAATLQLSFRRIQFTPDLLPGDVTGTQVYNPRTAEFAVKAGPIFANIVLADEINRAPAKVQSALLEAMQERQVTLGDETRPLPDPFLVLATQNPIEQEGTYPLPEAQVDRFMMKLRLDYPSPQEELQIVERMAHLGPPPQAAAVLGPADLAALRTEVEAVHVAPSLRQYIIDLVQATRRPDDFGLRLGRYVQYGASPRGSIALVLAAKAHAVLAGRDYASPDDVKAMAADVLRHRLILTYEADADERTADDLLAEVLAQVKVP